MCYIFGRNRLHRLSEEDEDMRRISFRRRELGGWAGLKPIVCWENKREVGPKQRRAHNANVQYLNKLVGVVRTIPLTRIARLYDDHVSASVTLLRIARQRK